MVPSDLQEGQSVSLKVGTVSYIFELEYSVLSFVICSDAESNAYTKGGDEPPHVRVDYTENPEEADRVYKHLQLSRDIFQR